MATCSHRPELPKSERGTLPPAPRPGRKALGCVRSLGVFVADQAEQSTAAAEALRRRAGEATTPAAERARGRRGPVAEGEESGEGWRPRRLGKTFPYGRGSGESAEGRGASQQHPCELARRNSSRARDWHDQR